MAEREAKELRKEHRIWSQKIWNWNPGSITHLWGELSLSTSLTSCHIGKTGTLGGLAIACDFYKDQVI